MYRLGQLALAVALLATLGCSSPERPPHVTGPWIREAPEGMTMTAGYLVIHNDLSRDVVIVGASSPDFGQVEFHNTVTENNVSRMRQERQVHVPAGGSVAFEPGGRHLMLMQAARDLKEGDEVTIELLFADGGQLHFTAPVHKQGN
jgi:copper(I)-binding protein